ncbi:MAG: class I SAM-dependent methyltransferase [Gammaproteobacteria bacterium]|nr:class I SAM-dependent methyltransferase [Gammaproteobacteria bacterium]MDD9850654.1 class I SAM-dependent methyltransferase [Gammaproteobacteria bacterium]
MKAGVIKKKWRGRRRLLRPLLRWRPLYVARKRIALRLTTPRLVCDTGALLPAGQLRLAEILRGGGQWSAVHEQFARYCGNIPAAGGITADDRRAVYCIVSGTGAASILEIGTHRGISTTLLALALHHGGAREKKLVSVDVFDVNRENGGGQTPAARMERMGFAGFVEFVQADSVGYLRCCREKYDLIFLDGDHRAPAVYREIPAALKLLNPGGVILLHDYHPGHRPLPIDANFYPGPSLAVEKLRREGANITVLPLGTPPWNAAGQPSTLALVLRAGQ